MKAAFQARASFEGRRSQEIAADVLEGVGFRIVGKNLRYKELGLTINFVAEDKGGVRWYFDVSGAFVSPRGGLLRTDTVWKSLGRAVVLANRHIRPVVLLTTNLPRFHSGGFNALHSAGTAIFFDAIELTPPLDRSRLRHYASGGAHERPIPGFWKAEEIYGAALTRNGPLGEEFSAPVALTGDPIRLDFSNDAVKGMSHRVKVFLPSISQGGAPLDAQLRKRVGEEIKKIMAKVGGGCTSHEGEGHWIDPLGGVADEQVIVLETYSENKMPPNFLKEIVSLVLKELDQHTAALIIDDRMLQFARTK